MICVSIVSHNNASEVRNLILKLSKAHQVTKIIVVFNNKELISWVSEVDLDKVILFWNINRHGFGANHNFSFSLCAEKFFCVLNPDVEFLSDVNYCFTELIKSLDYSSVSSPNVLNSHGISVVSRYKLLPPFRYFKFYSDNKILWLSGCFHFWHSSVYSSLGGFDEDFFMYYEDVDICVRARKAGHSIGLVKNVFINHDGNRGSWREMNLFKSHLRSFFRFWFKIFF